jgi:hypothetical protein
MLRNYRNLEMLNYFKRIVVQIYLVCSCAMNSSRCCYFSARRCLFRRMVQYIRYGYRACIGKARVPTPLFYWRLELAVGEMYTIILSPRLSQNSLHPLLFYPAKFSPWCSLPSSVMSSPQWNTKLFFEYSLSAKNFHVRHADCVSCESLKSPLIGGGRDS